MTMQRETVRITMTHYVSFERVFIEHFSLVNVSTPHLWSELLVT